MMNTALLAPAAVLIAWTMVVMFYLYFTRFAAFRAAGVDLGKASVGARYSDIESQMPPRINWPSHNYTHLVEQPTLFYAVIAVLVLAGDTATSSMALAWAYTGLRILHSVWQIFVNRIPVRVTLFITSSLCLVGLSVNALRATVF